MSSRSICLTLLAATVFLPPGQLQADEVGYRLGLHEDFERIVFDWHAPANVQMEPGESGIKLTFEPETDFVAHTNANGTGELIKAVNILDRHTVELKTMKGARIEPLNLDNHRLGFDILPPVDAVIDQSARMDTGQPNDGYRRDLMIQSLLARIEVLEGMAPTAGPRSEDSQNIQNSAAADGTSRSLREDLLIDRALERTLASDGTLLLRQGEIEIEPSLRYSLADDSTPVFITDVDDISLFVGSNEQRRQNLSPSLALKAGLPYDSQIEAEIPYIYSDERVVTEVGGGGAAERSDSGSGLGDLRVGFAKTLMRGEDLLPDVVGRVFWDTATGERSDSGVSLGGGRHEFGASISVLKRQDPLAFSGVISAETSLKDKGIERGDRLGIGISTVLAASPHTSLKLGYNHQLEAKTEFNGNNVAGSGRSFGILSLGAAAVVANRTLLDLTIGVGLGDDAPDVTARLGLPMRFRID